MIKQQDMEPKQRLFIYDRKEMGVLILLGVMVALFAFTLGVHLGKRVGPKVAGNGLVDTPPVETIPDSIPNRQDLTEQGKNVPQAVEEGLDDALHQEVERTGIRLDAPKQLELPKDAPADKVAKSAAPQEKRDDKREEKREEKRETARREPRLTKQGMSAALRPAPAGRYTLQVGSHQTLEEARDQVDALDALGLKPYLREVNLKKKGTWFRVFLGGYPSKEEASEAGNRYKENHMIDSFIVANRVED
jgi:cell division protein FtsN